MESKTSEEINKRGRSRTLNSEEKFFLVLVRLRYAFPLEELAIRILTILATKKTVQDTMPNCFKKEYPSTRVILDCTQIFIEMPTSYRSQSATFSSYKHHNTAKGLVGIAPNGAVTFVSDLYAGRFSDKKITKNSGIYNLLQNGDSVMADRGFELDDDLPEGIPLNIPLFLNGKSQVSLEEENETRRIASVRVHVERAIERV
ncbi:uncharacterized protein LOC130613510 [Hydractinia symbiolongicarpus]|uniref:uncharacterized protein LOC130613510 n=1 Tax=Hydractinia symbiolongicarpus TaxID=13093 RepID=UPI00254FD855|nr:uncharacterized protein LOC130613510 [Hydractinia symbiolongicarpus]